MSNILPEPDHLTVAAVAGRGSIWTRQINNCLASVMLICATLLAIVVVHDATELAKFKLQLQFLREYRSGTDRPSFRFLPTEPEQPDHL